MESPWDEEMKLQSFDLVNKRIIEEENKEKERIGNNKKPKRKIIKRKKK